MTLDWLKNIKVAHRGLHNEQYPENSIGAFENAIKHHFVIELDVQLLSDNTLVVFHDPTLTRMCGENIAISKLTSQNLDKYHLLDSQYTIPTLHQVLDTISGSVPIIIEIKPCKNRKLISQLVYQTLQEYSGEYAIKSFDHLIVRWFRKHAPHIPRGMLSSYFRTIKLNILYRFVITRLLLAKTIRPDFISYEWHDIPNRYLNKYLKNHNIPILAWTIKDSRQEDYIMQFADNIIFEGYLPHNHLNN